MVVLIPKKGDQGMSSSYLRNSPSNCPLLEELCGFRPAHGKVDKLSILFRLLEGGWEIAQLVHM